MIARRQCIDLDDVQAGVIRALKLPLGAYVFVRVDDAEEGRRWLTGLLDEVVSEGGRGERQLESALNLSFTYAGLEALAVSQEVLETLPEDFREGMARRAERLGDTGPSSPAHWDEGLGTGDAHVSVALYAQSEHRLLGRLDALRAEVEGASGLAVVNEQRAQTLATRCDHFGFSVGMSDVAVEGSGSPARPGQGVHVVGGRWRPLKAGEFLLGYIDEDGVLPPAPPAPLGQSASYLVYRKLYMDVALFTAYTRQAAEAHSSDPELIAAKIIGRWRDGTPLVLSPDRPDPELAADRERANDFLYSSDPHGFRCPLGAHVRRCNPRDAMGYGNKLTKRHRIIRRGLSYGPGPEDPAQDDGVDRGVIFLGYQASLERQFETIQALWVDDGDAFGLGDDKDFLLGDGEGSNKMTLQGDPPRFLAPQPSFVTTKGGEYLFQPGMKGLHSLAAAPAKAAHGGAP